MTRGTGNGLVRGGPIPIGDVICFEVAYDGLVRSSVRAGAQLVVVQTNNATFGHTAETYQQLAMSRLRAVETGRTVVQVATSGKSAVINRSGQVMAESGALFTPDVIVSSVPLSRSTTPATRLGAWPELALCLVAAGALAAAAITVRRRRHEPTGDDAAPEPADEPAIATR
jgi:apolipoprotein N-acyltransferase